MKNLNLLLDISECFENKLRKNKQFEDADAVSDTITAWVKVKKLKSKMKEWNNKNIVFISVLRLLNDQAVQSDVIHYSFFLFTLLLSFFQLRLYIAR